MGTGNNVLMINKKDTVAVALVDLAAGTSLSLSVGDRAVEITTTQLIQFGHKVALYRMGPGDAVVKYGEVIGRATREILPGEHVHTHNVDPMRGRGDLAAKRRGEGDQ